jgi:hypothetical protein
VERPALRSASDCKSCSCSNYLRRPILISRSHAGQETASLSLEQHQFNWHDGAPWGAHACALGKPFGNAIVTAECTIDGLIGSCADALLLDSFQVERKKGPPKQVNISDIFRATGCVDLGGVAGVCDTGDLQFNNVWIFNIPELLEYFWDYDNNGSKLMQVRFYPTTCGSFTTVP